jgi:hypothetical protein
MGLKTFVDGVDDAMLYPAFSKCLTCNIKHLYMAFAPSQLALLKKLVEGHKEEKMARKTLKCIEMSLDSAYKDGYHGRFKCAHCNNEYIAVEMSDAELKYLKHIIDHIWCPCSGIPQPNDSGSDIDDSTRHRLADILYERPIPDVRRMLKRYSKEEIYRTLDQCPDIHIREFRR